MKVIKRNSTKYPIKVRLSNGKKLIIPKQSQFDNEFLRKHGCSLMAAYIALQWCGVKKYPIHLLKWHKVNTPADCMPKVTVKATLKGIEYFGGKAVRAKYYQLVTEERIREALKLGHLVIMEQKNPIHTIVLFPDDGNVYMASHGKISKVKVKAIAKTATTNSKYRGMIVVKDVREK